ncbi:PRC-barrel domain-containing protein [Rhodovulum sp. YEN HP10]|uniref:PRC-barrel domain-containing protein n=1 Tax=Rhodovulum sp. HP10 TaxID=3387397 RepID=UPI0039E19FF4
MKRILATTALATLVAMPVLAQSQGAASAPDVEVAGQSMSADTLIGKRIYVATGESDGLSMTDLTDAPDSWEDVGEIGDVYIDGTGTVNAVIADIGGFLGIGEREVALQMDSLQFAPDADDAGEYFVVFQGDPSTLEGKEAYDRTAMDTEGDFLGSGNQHASSEGRIEPGAEGTDMAAGGGMDNGMTSGTPLSETERAELTAEDLQGHTLVGANGERIGKIGELVLTDDGRIDKVIVDVGGFLGIGSKQVQLAYGELNLSRDEDGALKVSTVQTKDTLKSLPEWTG